MANNRMIMVCNKCIPTDEEMKADDWGVNMISIGKWYPVGSYSWKDNEELGKQINDFLDKHAHGDHTTANEELDIIQNENPVRLTYEIWVRDMPAIKKWEMK